MLKLKRIKHCDAQNGKLFLNPGQLSSLTCLRPVFINNQ